MTSRNASSNRGGNRARSTPRPAGVPSIVSGDMIMRGSIESGGEIQFDGEIDGDIRAKGLVVGEGAKVTGEVSAEKVRVSGTVEGSIHGVEVELAAGAFVKGDITHTSLSIESGARFEGNCRHSDDPLGDGRVSSRAPTLPAPSPITTDASARAAAPQQPAQSHQSTERPMLIQEVDEPTSSLAQAASGDTRELMPQRSEPTADRTFVKRASTDLR